MARKSEFGGSWWAKRWIAVLESFGWSNRLQRGRSYARYGNVLEVVVAPGEVRAKVRGSRPRPYKVTIRVKPLDDAEWQRVTSALAKQAVFAARLLAGEMPENIEEAFAQSKVGLFPASSRDIITTCSCPDWANPCKHVAAVYYVLGQEFDRDPFLLFLLRGRSRDELVTALREKRVPVACPGADGPSRSRADAAAAQPGGAAARGRRRRSDGGGRSGAEHEDDGQAALQALYASAQAFWSGNARRFEAVPISVKGPAVSGAILRRLGKLGIGGTGREAIGTDFTAVLADYYDTVSREALALAYGNGYDHSGDEGRP